MFPIFLDTLVQEHLEVEVELQLGDAEPLILTLYGQSNHSSLDLVPPEEQEEEEDEKKDDEGHKAFYCCLPGPPTSLDSANQSHCLLWLANQTVSSATAKAKLPWKRTQRGWCQDKRAEPLCSPCGQCGFTLRSEETIRDGEIGHSVFI